jgi:protein-glutamine gamma-glutamyltransferase
MNFQNNENFEKLFKAVSYGVASCGLLSLFFAGGVDYFVTLVFFGILMLSWVLEKTAWQLNDKVSVFLIFLVIPLSYIDWKFQLTGTVTRDAVIGTNLSRLVLILGAIKLLQRKTDRDWIFIYIISFFQILLAAGIGISPLFFASLVLYLLFAFSSIILFEIRKTSRLGSDKSKALKETRSTVRLQKSQLLKLPITSFVLLLFIITLAVPLFFVFPRVGGAGLGSNLNNLTGFTGFSDSVKLGEIGKLQQSDEVVMRIRVEGNAEGLNNKYFRWRGVALDSFENQIWRKSRSNLIEPFAKTERDFFIVDGAKDSNQLVTQTVYLEPLDTPILFSLSRPVAVQGNFPQVNKDSEGSLSTAKSPFERATYKIYSDVSVPNDADLRKDNSQYPITSQRYFQTPKKLDQRIPELTAQIIKDAKAKNRYDQARAVEKYLQTQFGYTLEMKAGGSDPLADFLFNVREGHCEYFASAMAIMLRTQGIATRVVNGFQQGEYNETADVFVVRQKDAHSWVEVYFPQEKVWVPFDPTPSAGQFGQTATMGLTDRINKYIEALETFWIQYVVAFDNQEQRSLFRSIRTNLSEQKDSFSGSLNEFQKDLEEWWSEVRGDKGLEESIKAIAVAIGYSLAIVTGIFLIFLLLKRFKALKLAERLKTLFTKEKENSIIEFYERMQKVLARHGIKREPHQTPLEFAFALNMPEAIGITEKYNRVRFGEKNLSSEESREIENWLKDLEKKNKEN